MISGATMPLIYPLRESAYSDIAMLSFWHYNSSLHHHSHPLPPCIPIAAFSTSSSFLPRHRPQNSPESPAGDTLPDSSPFSEPISRTHNAKTASLLSRHLLRQSPFPRHWEELQLHEDAIPLEERVKRQELSLIASRRAPRFPGSISSYRSDVSTSPLQTLFPSSDDEDEEEDVEIIIKAVVIRRKVTAEIFMQAMKKGKFGLTYSSNLASKLGDFLDFVMIQAADLKRSPEFENSSFNHRAKIVIQDLGVVPLIRWLKHNELSYPKIVKLLNMARGGELESVRRLAEWLKTIHVKGEFIGPVLTKAGDNVLERSNEELDEIVEYLESKGVKRDWMGYVMSRSPQLLSYSIDELRTRVKFFTDMGMNDKDFGTMVFEYSRVLGYFSLEEMNQKFHPG
ncbi:Transcription termination factor MTERF2, chloroplastic [Linum grandiflorum]